MLASVDTGTNRGVPTVGYGKFKLDSPESGALLAIGEGRSPQGDSAGNSFVTEECRPSGVLPRNTSQS